MAIAIRLGGPADVETAASIFLRSNLARRQGRPMSPEHLAQVTERLRDPVSWFLLVEEDGEAVGMACAMALRADGGAGAIVPGGLFLGYLFTLPERWGQGIGGTVLDAVVVEAQRQGYHRIELWTHHENNERAHRLYRSRGFSPTGLTMEGDLGATMGQWARTTT